jgi:hypothetical protein
MATAKRDGPKNKYRNNLAMPSAGLITFKLI